MAMHIQQINIRDLGPVRQFQADLKKLNLIFGRNEQGKTWIVEFIVQSLFRKSKSWRLRDVRGNGKIILTGFGEAPLEFTPASEKLETLLDRSENAWPPDFSRLLVVKGADLALTADDGGIDKGTLKQFLSNQRLLDRIQDNISDTIQKSTIEGGQILGPKRKEIVRREELLNQLKWIDSLFDQIARGYGGSTRKTLEIEKENLLIKRDALIRARGYTAHLLAREIMQLESDTEALDERTLESVREQLRDYHLQKEQLQQIQKDLKEAAARAAHYPWIEKAVNLYRERLTRLPPKPRLVYLLLPVIFAVMTAWFMIGARQWPSLASLVLTLVSSGIYVLLTRRHAGRQADREELERIVSEYEHQFKQPFSGLSQMEVILETLRKAHDQIEPLSRQLDRFRLAMDQKKQLIDQAWITLYGQVIPESGWNGAVHDHAEKIRSMRQTLQKKQIQLAGLQIGEPDYVETDPGIRYDQKQLDAVASGIDRIESEIAESYNKLNTLKHLICKETGDTVDLSWEKLIENLQKRREETLSGYRDVTAEIMGKLAVHRVIERLRSVEDEKIADGLNDPEISGPLKKMTGRYTQIRMHEEDIFVGDEFNEFVLSDLSTGTREQVLMALRLGFASKLTGRDRLFLILDDAFQHSDWKRRPHMVDMMVDLAKDGWQIIYFTMDDHIRDLFREKGKALGREFLYKAIE
ncbi:hypothetical protein JW948_14580 [bacterium]|nr:hypothetical protein [bacterium]